MSLGSHPPCLPKVDGALPTRVLLRGLGHLTALLWASDAGIANKHMSSDGGNRLSPSIVSFWEEWSGWGEPRGAWRGWLPCMSLPAVPPSWPSPQPAAVPHLPTQGPAGPVPRQLFLVVATCVSPWHPVSSLLISGLSWRPPARGFCEPCYLRSRGHQLRPQV